VTARVDTGYRFWRRLLKPTLATEATK